MPLAKSKIYAALAERADVSRAQAAQVVEALVDLAIAEAAKDPKGFTLPGLGKLIVVQRAARMARNPRTGESVQVPAKKAVKFRLAKACKEALA